MKIRKMMSLVRLRVSKWIVTGIDGLKARGWLIELLIALPIALLAYRLWVLGQFPAGGTNELIGYVWSTLPVLAISNAMPMLGATAVLARYSVSEKPAETMKQIAEALEADADRYQSERGTLLAQPRAFRRAMRGAPPVLTFFVDGQQIFTPRPNWDGVWFFPTAEPRTAREQAAHELTYCAIRVVQLVHKVRRRKTALVGGRLGGTNGSNWFLERLEKAGSPKLTDTMLQEDAWTWVFLAYQSLHYMREEFDRHREASDLNEARETEFVDLFCEYMKWLGFFHCKALIAQWCVLCYLYPTAATRPVPPSLERMILAITATKKALATAAAANLPRRATAARVAQVRKGVFLPLLGTASATLICLSLKPLAGWRPDATILATTLAYALIAASLAANFTFGLWLIFPPAKATR